MKLTVIIPVYNEINTISILLDNVIKTVIKKQIIIIDDFSTDGSREFLIKNSVKNNYNLILHKKNLGKGAAIKSAQKYVEGDYVIIQDADLEYSPKDYVKFINTVSQTNFKVIYGSRVLIKDRKNKINGFSHKFRIFGNQILTVISNLLNNQKLTDAHTCYKMIEAELFKSIKLCENGFAFCPEITTKLSKKGIEILEIPINYNGRTYKEGKKIKTIHALEALIALIKYRFFK